MIGIEAVMLAYKSGIKIRHNYWVNGEYVTYVPETNHFYDEDGAEYYLDADELLFFLGHVVIPPGLVG